MNAWQAGNLEEVTEVVMATTYSPTPFYFYAAARVYFAQDNLELAAVLQEGEGSTDQSSGMAERSKLQDDVRGRVTALKAELRQNCPPSIPRQSAFR